ncbi:uncharacterized protein [Triticum aestivum]|uniref:uncharacterized protein n=1 Tax=Triticum aestivum TaxID=4565 RepID=UPI001D025FE7|nr:uncharacterized protein LOC123125835 [Triticum aestivum]
MASSEPPGDPPPFNKKSAPAAPTTICDVGDDLLCEVFLRLPSLLSLVRAALACPAFLRAVRSSPAFRRRFRELHPAPLLGVFLDIYGPAMPVFVPVRRRSDPDQAAAVRGADVFLTHVPDDEGEGEGDGWVMTECRGGYVVLFKQRTKRVAVYDPLTRGLHLIPAPPEEVSRDPESALIEFHVVTSEEDRRSFQVVCVCMEREEVQVAAFSPDSSEWQISPEAATPQLFGDGTLVNGCVYWADGDNIHVLNTATLQFSRIDSPHMGWRQDVKLGETSDGHLCLAATIGNTLAAWVRRTDDDGVGKWIPRTRFPMLDAICELELQFEDEGTRVNVFVDVVAIIAGTVYLFTSRASAPDYSGWFLSFCIETEMLEKVCPITLCDPCYPYVTAWPPVLVGNIR